MNLNLIAFYCCIVALLFSAIIIAVQIVKSYNTGEADAFECIAVTLILYAGLGLIASVFYSLLFTIN